MEQVDQRSQRRALKLDPRDNVIVALFPLEAGEIVACDGIAYTIAERIAPKHKFAAIDFEPGSDVIMYGVLVGKASQKISRGFNGTTELITCSNVPKS